MAPPEKHAARRKFFGSPCVSGFPARAAIIGSGRFNQTA